VLTTAIVPVSEVSSLTGFTSTSIGCDTDPISGGRGPGGKDVTDGDGDDDRCRRIGGDVAAGLFLAAAGDAPADLHLAVVPIMATELEVAAKVVKAVAST